MPAFLGQEIVQSDGAHAQKSAAQIQSTPALQEVARIVEFGEGEAWVDMQLSAPPAYATRWGIQVKRIGQAIVLIASQVDAILFNRVIGLGVAEPATERMIDEIIGCYRQAGVSRFALQISPVATPALDQWLIVRGFVRHDNWAKVYRRPEPPMTIQTDLRIERIGREHTEEFGRTACEGFATDESMHPSFDSTIGHPGWRHYLAYDGDTPVATGALYVRNGIGWLGMGSTLPRYRRRGAQGAIMAQRIRDGAGMGCRWLVTETGEDQSDRPNPSYHNMMRTGFELAYLRPNYIHQE